MDIRKLFPSPWLNAVDLGNQKFELVIEAVTTEKVRNPNTNREEMHPAIKFHKAKKRLLFNKTQAFAIATVTGEYDTDKWPGHTVVLAPGIANNRKPTIVIESPANKPPAANVTEETEDTSEETEYESVESE